METADKEQSDAVPSIPMTNSQGMNTILPNGSLFRTTTCKGTETPQSGRILEPLDEEKAIPVEELILSTGERVTQCIYAWVHKGKTFCHLSKHSAHCYRNFIPGADR